MAVAVAVAAMAMSEVMTWRREVGAAADRALSGPDRVENLTAREGPDKGPFVSSEVASGRTVILRIRSL